MNVIYIYCCCQSVHAFTSRYDSTLFGHAFFTLKVFLHDITMVTSCIKGATGYIVMHIHLHAGWYVKHIN